jgi:hypothetical protein
MMAGLLNYNIASTQPDPISRQNPKEPRREIRHRFLAAPSRASELESDTRFRIWYGCCDRKRRADRPLLVANVLVT